MGLPAVRNYNCRKSKEDARDLKYATLMASKPVPIPTHVDRIRKKMPLPFDQGSIGSCTDQALAGYLCYLELCGKAPEVFTPGKFVAYSRLFNYYGARELEGSTGEDAGAEIRDIVKTAQQIGACSEALWPYVESNLFKKPSKAAYDEAAKHKISMYHSVATLDEIRHALASDLPVIGGICVYESFESEHVTATGRVPMPMPNEQMLGGHAILIVGYDDVAKVLICRNSWGVDWGDHGYFYLPYAFITVPGYANDFWVIQK